MKKKEATEVTANRAFPFEALVNRVLFDKPFAEAVEKGKITQVDKVLKEMGVTVERTRLRAMLDGLKANDLGVIRELSKSLSQENNTGT